MNISLHEHWMKQALALAEEAARHGEVPVGAVVVRDNEIIGSGFNQPIETHDPSAHAEIQAIRQAALTMRNYRLPGCTLYVTLEPCTMCVGAIIHARIQTLVFGAREPRFGAIVSGRQLLEQGPSNHHVEWIEGVLAQPCGEILQRFFQQRRHAAMQQQQ